MSAARVITLACLLTACVEATEAQETIPKEMMAILARGPGGYGSFDLRVGGPPEGFPREVLPAGATVGATAISDRTTTVVAVVLGEVQRYAEERRLLDAGWVSAMPMVRGFASTASDQPISLCRGSDFVGISFFPKEGGGQYVRASVTADPRRSCAPRPEMGFADVQLPSLVPPEGVRSMSTGSGSSLDTMHASARLERRLPPERIARHYATQMEDAGWKLTGVTAPSDDFAVARFTTRTKGGEDITAMIAITALAGTEEMDALLHVVRNKSDRRMPGFGSVIIR